MELGAFLEALSTNYVAQYESVWSEPQSKNAESFPQIALEISGGTFKNLYVADFVVWNDAVQSIVEVTPADDTYLQGGPFLYGSISLRFESVSWDGVRFTIEPELATLPEFEMWFDRWIDLEGVHRIENSKRASVIHSVSLDENVIDVDFGTAPPKAFLELLDVFAANGVTQISVASSRN